jgi:hypothetical protein
MQTQARTAADPRAPAHTQPTPTAQSRTYATHPHCPVSDLTTKARHDGGGHLLDDGNKGVDVARLVHLPGARVERLGEHWAKVRERMQARTRLQRRLQHVHIPAPPPSSTMSEADKQASALTDTHTHTCAH